MKPLARFLVVVVIGAAVYGKSLLNRFVWDDNDAILENYFIRQWTNAPHLLDREYFVLSNELSYRPLVTLTYFVDYAAWKLNPAGYHLANVAFHILSALALLALVRKLSGSDAVATVAALLYVVHPATTEAVNVVSFREDIMAGLFMFLGLGCYIGCRRATGIRALLLYGATLVLYFVGLLSKEMAATLPALVVLHDLVAPGNGDAPPKRRALLRRCFTVYAGFLAVLALYLAIRFVFMHNPKEEAVGYMDGSFRLSMLTTTRIVATYIKHMFLPFSLSAHYTWPPSRSVFDTDVILSVLLIGFCLWYGLRRLRDDAATGFAVLGFFIVLAPVLNVIPIVNMAADRYLYVPTAFFCTAAAMQIARRRRAAWIVAAAVLALGATTVVRNTHWRDSRTIWSKTAERYPDSADIHHELGDVHHREGRIVDAVVEYERALALNPNHLAVRVNLGVCYDTLGDQDRALEQYQMAVKLNPTVSKIHNNIGNIYYKKGRPEDAIAAYREAIRLNPYYPQPYNNLSTTYAGLGRFDEAIETTKQALRIAPERTESKLNLARIYLGKGDDAAAMAILQELLAAGSNVREIRHLLGEYYTRTGRPGPAIEQYRLLEQAVPGDVIVQMHLARLYEQTGDGARALVAYRTFLARWQGEPALAQAAREAVKALESQ